MWFWACFVVGAGHAWSSTTTWTSGRATRSTPILRKIPEMGAGDLGVDAASVGAAGAKVKRLDYFVPEMGEGAEMLEGSTEEIIAKLIELLKAKGGLK